MAIPTLKKPIHTTCQHECEAGCAIYASRPQECREWSCFWLYEGSPLEPVTIPGWKRIFRDEERPDKVGIFFTPSGPTVVSGRRLVWLAMYEAQPGDSEKWRARKVIERVARKHLILHVAARKWEGPQEMVRFAAEITAQWEGDMKVTGRW